MIKERLAKRIKAILALRGMTQEQLAEATGMSTQTISLICQGKSNFRIESIEGIEKVLKCTLVMICDEDLEKEE